MQQSSVSLALCGLEEARNRNTGLRGGRGRKEVAISVGRCRDPPARLGVEEETCAAEERRSWGRLEGGGWESRKRSYRAEHLESNLKDTNLV